MNVLDPLSSSSYPSSSSGDAVVVVRASNGLHGGRGASPPASSVPAVQADPSVDLAGRGLHELPAADAQRVASFCTNLDLSHNSIRSGANLNLLTKLTDLILDHNKLSLAALSTFPSLPQLDTLWLNNNALDNLSNTLDVIVAKFPRLSFLSMLRNPLCPDVYFSDGEAEAYKRYRLYVIHRMPNLAILDSTAVTSDELREAKRVGRFMRVATPDATQYEQKSRSSLLDKERHQPDPSRVAAAMVEPVQPAAFLARGKLRYDGTHSEGNRFIANDDL